jgi:tetratricopeptide (TPR) repeat protein
VKTGYSLRETARILKIAPARLRYWQRTELVRASGATAGPAPAFAFGDLVGLRTLLGLLQRGVPLRRIRRSVETVRRRIPELERPLDALRAWGGPTVRLVVRHRGLLLEPEGQLVLDFQEGGAPSPAPLGRSAGAEPGEGEEPLTALEWFERGCALDSDPATHAEAVAAYQRAIAADPEFADAHCNLGTVHYNQGQRARARACYERVLALLPGHVEGNFNLGNLFEEEGRHEAALRHYKAAMRSDPLYPDVQLNLALLYEKLGLRRRSREHWRRYLQLDPNGRWAETARKRLAEAPPD